MPVHELIPELWLVCATKDRSLKIINYEFIANENYNYAVVHLSEFSMLLVRNIWYFFKFLYFIQAIDLWLFTLMNSKSKDIHHIHDNAKLVSYILDIDRILLLCNISRYDKATLFKLSPVSNFTAHQLQKYLILVYRSEKRKRLISKSDIPSRFSNTN